ncbi:MAG: hypothetical protein V4592_22815 [Bacteroidota bacterium]
MKNDFVLKGIFIIAFIFSINKTYSQSRSSIGFGYGINKPFSDEYNTGRGGKLQGAIAIGNKWAVLPALAYEGLSSKHRVLPGEYSYYNQVNNVDLVYLGASARYSFTNEWFAKAGPIIYAAGGNEDLVGLGIGGSAGIGYNLEMSSHSTLELSLGTEVIDLRDNHTGTTPLAAFKVAYVFNFKRLQ